MKAFSIFAISLFCLMCLCAAGFYGYKEIDFLNQKQTSLEGLSFREFAGLRYRCTRLQNELNNVSRSALIKPRLVNAVIVNLMVENRQHNFLVLDWLSYGSIKPDGCKVLTSPDDSISIPICVSEVNNMGLYKHCSLALNRVDIGGNEIHLVLGGKSYSNSVLIVGQNKGVKDR